MSKIVIAIIIVASFVPIILFLIFNEPDAVQDVMPVPEIADKEIVIPEPGTTGSTSQQCAVCALITDSGSQEQCLQDFACN